MCKICSYLKHNTYEKAQFYFDTWKDTNCCANIEFLPMMPNLEVLTIHDNEKITNIHLFPKLQRLEITNCKNIYKIPKFPELAHLSMRLINKNIQIPILPKIRILEYSNCKNFIIRKQPTLNCLVLIRCKNIIKINKMKNITSLNINGHLPKHVLSGYPKKILFPKLSYIRSFRDTIKKLPILFLYLNFNTEIANRSRFKQWIMNTPILKEKRLKILIHLQQKIKLKHNTRSRVGKITYAYHPLYIIGYNIKKQLEKSLKIL